MVTMRMTHEERQAPALLKVADSCVSILHTGTHTHTHTGCPARTGTSEFPHEILSLGFWPLIAHVPRSRTTVHVVDRSRCNGNSTRILSYFDYFI